MAIAIDAANNGTAGSGITNVTYSQTCTGTNLILFVGVRSDTLPTSVTYNGVSLTNINGANAYGVNTVSLWYLVNPAIGAHTVSVTITSSGTIQSVCCSYTGASQTGVPDSQNTNSVTGTNTITTSTTTIANNSWVVGMVGDNGAGVLSASTGATQRARIAGGNGNSNMLVDTNGVVTPAGSKSMTITDGATANIGFCVASFAPVSVITARNLALLGIG